MHEAEFLDDAQWPVQQRQIKSFHCAFQFLVPQPENKLILGSTEREANQTPEDFV